MESIFDIVKTNVDIKTVVEDFGVMLDHQGKGLCPFHTEKTPSFSIKKDDNTFKCFGCGVGGDAIDFVAKIKGIEGLDAAKWIAERYNITLPENNSKNATKIDIKGYITKCIASVGETDYFQKRGLTATTINKFCLGYDTYRKAIVLPYSSKLEYYQTRSVVDKTFFKPKVIDAGTEPLFNRDALYKSKEPIFVVESPICALSIMQCGGVAIALCGVGNAVKLIKEVKSKKPTATLILALDNDDAGQTKTMELANGLFELNVQYDVYNVAGCKKDPNELLVENASELKSNIQNAKKQAKQKYSSLKKLFTADELQQREMRPIRWIVKGMLPEGLAILSAPSKYGKSWMMMQLCLAVTQGKPFLNCETEQCDCVYFSLEDSDRRFKNRLNICLKNKTAPKNFYGSTECKAMDNGLFEQLEELMDMYPNIRLVIIDTFQMVRGKATRNESVYSADYREMGAFKEFADRKGICILLVHHLRKMVDDNDVYNRISGSMGIMGASDTAWVLSRKKRSDEYTTLVTTGRDIDDKETILTLDKSTFNWEVVGSAEDEMYRKAKEEYENDPVIKTIKGLLKQHPSGWSGTSSELKVCIYDITGTLYSGSVETIGKTIRKYLDRLAADKIDHKEARGKVHTFTYRQPKVWNYCEDDDD